MHYSRLTGYTGPLIAFAGIIVAIWINRDWWSLTDNAISDLGKVGLKYNFILNFSLIASGVLTFYSASHISRCIDYIPLRAGIYLFMLSLIFLVLIGLFPEGTRPHGPVSYIFFYTGTIAMLVSGISLSRRKERIGYIIVAIVLVEIALAQITLRIFEGVAIPEFIAAIGITLSYYLLLTFAYSNDSSISGLPVKDEECKDDCNKHEVG